jgi:sulfatase maturation enzyme AslB (radical SAM superfamily)
MHPHIASRSERFDFVAKLRLFPDRVRAVLDRDLAAALSTVYLDVNTEICNHACSFCDGFHRSLRADHIPWARLERLVAEMQEIGVLAIVLAGDRGEPLLHPDIDALLSGIVQAGIQYGLYTNGTVIGERVWPWLPHAAFVRVSADAATAATHRRMHVYPAGRADFADLLSNVERLAACVPDLGISFVLDEENHREISLAADTFLSRGAAFIEYKPKYLPGYRVDAAWLGSAAAEVRSQLGVAVARWNDRIVFNNQLENLLWPNPDPNPLETPPRACLTSLLRLVISTHGCYTCTPYRGEPERRVGDILQESLLSVVESSLRHATAGRLCNRRCAYHDQNERLLAAQAGRAVPVEAPRARSGQDAFI